MTVVPVSAIELCEILKRRYTNGTVTFHQVNVIGRTSNVRVARVFWDILHCQPRIIFHCQAFHIVVVYGAVFRKIRKLGATEKDVEHIPITLSTRDRRAVCVYSAGIKSWSFSGNGSPKNAPPVLRVVQKHDISTSGWFYMVLAPWFLFFLDTALPFILEPPIYTDAVLIPPAISIVLAPIQYRLVATLIYDLGVVFTPAVFSAIPRLTPKKLIDLPIFVLAGCHNGRNFDSNPPKNRTSEKLYHALRQFGYVRGTVYRTRYIYHAPEEACGGYWRTSRVP